MLNPHFDALFQGLNNLSIIELEDLMAQIILLRKQKLPTVFSQAESDLLQKINKPLPKFIRRAYRDLRKKHRAETLTEIEHEELLELTAYNEAFTAKRLAHVLELAKLRKQTLDEVLSELDLNPDVYVA